MVKYRYNIKRIILLILAAVLALACAVITGCNKKPKQPVKPDAPKEVELPDGYDCFRKAVEAEAKESEKEGKVMKTFYSEKNIAALKEEKTYGFSGLVKYENNETERLYPTCMAGGRLYTTAYFLAKALGFGMTESGDGKTVIFSYGSSTVSYTDGKSEVDVNGEIFPSYEAMKKEGVFFVDAVNFASVVGLDSYYDENSGILLIYAKESGITEDALKEQIKKYDERFTLYDTVVYNPPDMKPDTTGIGIYKKVSPKDRLVGVAYTTWHRNDSRWGEGATWDMPLLGRYNSDNKDVIKQHGIWLRDAGVDFVFVDWSNDVGYDPATMRDKREDFRMIEEATETLFDVWSEIPGAPKICIFTGPGHTQQSEDTYANGKMQKKNDQIYDTFIRNPKYNSMYFYYEGKPLLMCYGATPSVTRTLDGSFTDDRFTIRWVTGFISQQEGLYDPETLVSTFHWSWEDRGAQTFAVKGKTAEAMTVTASWRAQGKEGQYGYIAPALRENGSTFIRGWQRAQLTGPKFALVVSFNEWVNGEQISLEQSKDIEPSETFGTLYLDILREQISIFKGKK